MSNSIRLAIALTGVIWATWLWFMISAAYSLPPGHDELITLLNMRNQALIEWVPFADISYYHGIFERPLAQYSDIAPMLKQTDVHPPLYYYFALTASKLGLESLFELRMISLVSVVIGAGVLVGLCYKISEWPLALPIFSVMVLSSGAVIYAASNARNYSLLFLIFSLMIMCLHRIYSHDRKGATLSYLALSLLSIAALWTHYFGALGVISIWAALGFAALRSKRDFGIYAGAAFLVVIGAFPLLEWLSVHLSAREAQYAGFTGWMEVFVISRILAEQVSFSSTEIPTWNMLLYIILGPVLLACVVLGVLRSRSGQVFGLAVGLFVGILGLLSLYFLTDKTLTFLDSSRYGMYLLVLLFLLLAFVSRSYKLLIVVIAMFSISSWMVGTLRISPWDWEHRFADFAEFLSTQDHMTIFNDKRRGVEGMVLYRSTNGYVGFLDSNPTVSGEEMGGINEVRMFVSEDVSSNQQYLNWDEFLKTRGFEKVDTYYWVRSPD